MAPKANDGLQSVAEPGQESQNSQASEPGGKKPVKAGKLPPPGKDLERCSHTFQGRQACLEKCLGKGKPSWPTLFTKKAWKGSKKMKPPPRGG